MDDVIAYIQSLREQGYTDAQIRQQLLQSGWPQDIVNAAFSPNNQPVTQPQPPALQKPPKQAKFLPFVIVFILLVIVAVVFFVFLRGDGTDEDQRDASSSTSAVDQDFADSLQVGENDSQDGLEQARASTSRKNHVGKLLAWAEQYAANHSGTYPTSADTIDRDLAVYIAEESDFVDPLTNQPYTFTGRTPWLGEIQYVAGYSCDSNDELITSGFRLIAARTRLDDDSFYCQDNQ